MIIVKHTRDASILIKTFKFLGVSLTVAELERFSLNSSWLPTALRKALDKDNAINSCQSGVKLCYGTTVTCVPTLT